MAQRTSAGDFSADIAYLVQQAGEGAGPRTITDILATAGELAGRVDDDPRVLAWLREHAEALLAQQLLVAAVQSSFATSASSFAAALHDCRRALGPVPSDEVMAWLLEHYPGEVRAWMVKDQLPRLIAEALEVETAGSRAANEPS